MARRRVPNDYILKHTIRASKTFADAAQRLGLSQTCVRKHAWRIYARPQFRYGVEKLPNSDFEMRNLFRASRDNGGLAPLARRLGVTRQLLAEECDRVGVNGRMRVRQGLPDDRTLRRDMLACESFAALARQYHVRDWTIRNQAKRLGIPSPSKRGMDSCL
jgi:hypothetical protein